MNKVLVTGANGFVGRFMCDCLLRSNAPFRQAVRHEVQPRAENVVGVGEIDGATDWSRALAGISHVVHLAARVHVLRDVSSDPLGDYRRTNVAGTINLARQAVKAGVRRFIFVSTVKVNGEKTVNSPFTAGDEPAPADPYSVSKFEAEQALWQIAGDTGLEVVVIRPPLIYGKGVGGNFRRLLELAQSGLPLPLAAVHNVRSLLYVENLTDLIMTGLQHVQAPGHTFLASDGEDISTPRLLRLLAEAAGRSARLFSVPLPLLLLVATTLGRRQELRRLTDDLRIDCEKTRTILNWQPPFSLRDGIRRTVS
ncbi:MAG: NAD-dependent epimerase/dehydratase family protein [Deltaproteobacteria bacterium]|nr:NAD-dependent epimerase/dehydratase family protein [Deltaproteobacteria bacterium]